MDQSGLWVNTIKTFDAEKRDHEQLKECANALFKDIFCDFILLKVSFSF